MVDLGENLKSKDKAIWWSPFFRARRIKTAQQSHARSGEGATRSSGDSKENEPRQCKRSRSLLVQMDSDLIPISFLPRFEHLGCNLSVSLSLSFCFSHCLPFSHWLFLVQFITTPLRWESLCTFESFCWRGDCSAKIEEPKHSKSHYILSLWKNPTNNVLQVLSWLSDSRHCWFSLLSIHSFIHSLSIDTIVSFKSTGLQARLMQFGHDHHALRGPNTINMKIRSRFTLIPFFLLVRMHNQVRIEWTNTLKISPGT